MKIFLLLIYVFVSSVIFANEQKRNPIEERMAQEEILRFQEFSIISHRQNYLLPVTYNFRPNNRPYERLKEQGIDTGVDRVMRIETKFQYSFKFSVAKSLFNDRDNIWIGYTQQSYWQLYNQNSSRPFRETNYEPEIFYSVPTDMKIGGLDLKIFGFGFVHQSNGQTENLSRSWNRIYLSAVLNWDHFGFFLKPWYRIPDSPKDDNPDLEDYTGHFDFLCVYKNDHFTYTLKLRNSLKKRMKGLREFSVSFPVNDKLRGFFQYVNGYGESLLDYQVNTNRVGIGFSLSDIL